MLFGIAQFCFPFHFWSVATFVVSKLSRIFSYHQRSSNMKKVTPNVQIYPLTFNHDSKLHSSWSFVRGSKTKMRHFPNSTGANLTLLTIYPYPNVVVVELQDDIKFRDFIFYCIGANWFKRIDGDGVEFWWPCIIHLWMANCWYFHLVNWIVNG